MLGLGRRTVLASTPLCPVLATSADDDAGRAPLGPKLMDPTSVHIHRQCLPSLESSDVLRRASDGLKLCLVDLLCPIGASGLRLRPTSEGGLVELTRPPLCCCPPHDDPMQAPFPSEPEPPTPQTITYEEWSFIEAIRDSGRSLTVDQLRSYLRPGQLTVSPTVDLHPCPPTLFRVRPPVNDAGQADTTHRFAQSLIAQTRNPSSSASVASRPSTAPASAPALSPPRVTGSSLESHVWREQLANPETRQVCANVHEQSAWVEATRELRQLDGDWTDQQRADWMLARYTDKLVAENKRSNKVNSTFEVFDYVLAPIELTAAELEHPQSRTRFENADERKRWFSMTTRMRSKAQRVAGGWSLEQIRAFTAQCHANWPKVSRSPTGRAQCRPCPG